MKIKSHNLLLLPWVNVAALERAAGITPRTLQAYKEGRRGISRNSYSKLSIYLKKQGIILEP